MAQFKYDDVKHRLTGIFEGRLHTLVSETLQPLITREIKKYQQKTSDRKLTIDFNFQKVEFITSAFIRICVQAAKTVGKENFSIINTNPLIKRTLKIAGLDQELNVS